MLILSAENKFKTVFTDFAHHSVGVREIATSLQEQLVDINVKQASHWPGIFERLAA